MELPETSTPKVCGPVFRLVLNSDPKELLDLAMICPSFAGLAAAFTQALQVVLPVICNRAGLPRSTKLLEPLKLNALPYLPPAVQVAPMMLPVIPLPEASVTVVPLPSLKL